MHMHVVREQQRRRRQTMHSANDMLCRELYAHTIYTRAPRALNGVVMEQSVHLVHGGVSVHVPNRPSPPPPQPSRSRSPDDTNQIIMFCAAIGNFFRCPSPHYVRGQVHNEEYVACQLGEGWVVGWLKKFHEKDRRNRQVMCTQPVVMQWPYSQRCSRVLSANGLRLIVALEFIGIATPLCWWGFVIYAQQSYCMSSSPSRGR